MRCIKNRLKFVRLLKILLETADLNESNRFNLLNSIPFALHFNDHLFSILFIDKKKINQIVNRKLF